MIPRLVLLLSGLLFVSSCATVQQGNAEHDEKKLLQAGFRVIPAETAQQKATLAAIPPYQLQAQDRNGTSFYRYADPAQARLYVGGPAEFATYEQLLTKGRAHRASNLAQMSATNWRMMGPIVW